jgi:hypothetical protein
MLVVLHLKGHNFDDRFFYYYSLIPCSFLPFIFGQIAEEILHCNFLLSISKKKKKKKKPWLKPQRPHLAHLLSKIPTITSTFAIPII